MKMWCIRVSYKSSTMRLKFSMLKLYAVDEEAAVVGAVALLSLDAYRRPMACIEECKEIDYV